MLGSNAALIREHLEGRIPWLGIVSSRNSKSYLRMAPWRSSSSPRAAVTPSADCPIAVTSLNLVSYRRTLAYDIPAAIPAAAIAQPPKFDTWHSAWLQKPQDGAGQDDADDLGRGSKFGDWQTTGNSAQQEMLESATSPPKEPPPLRDSAAAEPASQSTAVISRAALESATSPPQEPPPLTIRSPQIRPRNPPRSPPRPRRQAPRYRRTSRCHYGGALLHHRRSHRHCAIGPPRSRSCNPPRSLPPPRRQAPRHRRSRCQLGRTVVLSGNIAIDLF